MKGLYFIFFLSIQFLYGQVGINTINPQESLHLAGTTGSIRVESLNSVNNDYNGGDVNNDGNMSNDTFPLYVDENGDFTLELDVLSNSEAEDEFDDTTLPTSTVELLGNNSEGKATTIIKSYTVTFNRPTLVEIKYNLSHKIYNDDSYTILNDLLARRVTNYITVTPDPDTTDGISNRKYGPCTKTHTSGSSNSIPGPFFNGSTVYIKVLSAGTYTINFVGEVSSSAKWQGAPGPNSLSTYVEFAIDSDFLFIRLY